MHMRHFTDAEFQRRVAGVAAVLVQRNLAGILIFRQESMYYLTGYDSTGYVSFQCMYLSCDQKISLLARAPELRSVRMTSSIEDVRIFTDDTRTDPALELRNMATELGAKGSRIGVEYNAIGLTFVRAKKLQEAFEGHAELQDASDIVDGMRLLKSQQELEYVAKAAHLAKEAFHTACHKARRGVRECELMAAMQERILAGGGDFSSGRWIVGCGPRAMLVKHFGAHHGRLAKDDQLQLEIGAAYCHYHSAWAQTLYFGKITRRHMQLYGGAVAALSAMLEECRPGSSAWRMYRAYASTIDSSVPRSKRLSAAGYSLGATYPPTWMDGLPLCEGNETVLRAGMVLFPQVFVFDDRRGITAGVGRTVVVTKSGCDILTDIPSDMLIQ